MPNREFPFNQPIHPEDNQSINRVFDRNYGNKLKSGDTTPLKYTIKDGDGEPLNKDRLITMNTKVILKYDGIIAYETAFDAIVENETDNYAGDLIARFKVEEVLPPDEKKPYVIEFQFEELDQSDEVVDRFIFPSGNTLELFITPSALNSDSEAIGRANDERLDNAVKRAIESDVVLLDIKDQEQQRIDNETARQSAESQRESTFTANETDRQSTFDTNENARQETFENNESERQTNYNELVDTGIMQENINEKLSESEQTYAPRLTNLEQNDANLTTRLAQKVGQGKKAELEDLSATVLSAIEGGDGTNFNLLSIPQDKSVTPVKTTFAKRINLFNGEYIKFALTGVDHNIVKPGGNLRSGLLNVEVGKTYTINASADKDTFRIGLLEREPHADDLTKRTFTLIESPFTVTVETGETHLMVTTSLVSKEPLLTITEGNIPLPLERANSVSIDLEYGLDKFLIEENERWEI